MKYNSNMKNFKPVVLKNLFAMCGRDEKIPELARDGSPAPLREHLKEEYSSRGAMTDYANYDFCPNKGLKIRIDVDDGSGELTLTVSQMATFIRGCVEDGSWKEPDSGENSEQEPQENPAPGKTFLDEFRENNPELEGIPDEEIVTELCPYENGFGKSVKLYQECDHIDCDSCWYKVCDCKFLIDEDTQEDINIIVEKHNSRAKSKAVSAETDTQITEVSEMSENKIVPAGGNVSADYQNATLLDAQIKASAAAAAANFEQLAFSLKEMRDGKRYKELGYNSFEEYCKQSLGITDRYARDIISILSLPPEYRNSSSGFGIKKLVLLAGITAEQREQIAQNIDIKDASNNDLKAEIKALKDKNKTLTDESERKSEINKALAEDIDEKRKELDKTKSDLRHELSRNKILQENSDKNNKKISALENQVKELESRPIDVAVVNSGKISDETFEKFEREKQQAIVDAVAEERRGWQDKADRDADTIDKLTAELETARKNKGAKKIFMLTVDENQLEKIRGIIGNVKFMEV